MKILTLFLLIRAMGLAAIRAQSAKPNIILTISDDQGFTDYGFMGHEVTQPPHLDRISSESPL